MVIRRSRNSKPPAGLVDCLDNTGTVAGGSIKCKIKFERNGEVQTRDWEAKLQQ
jgi:hypothetical protein